MALTLPGHSAPAVGFEVPLEMLAACHARVQHPCETLLRLVTHLRTQGPDRPAQEASHPILKCPRPCRDRPFRSHERCTS